MRGRRLVGVAAALLSLGPAWAFYRLLAGTPLVLVAAAVVPAVCWSGVVLLLDRDEPEPPTVLLAMFLWGAVVAALTSQLVNDHAYDFIAARRGAEWAQTVTPGLIAPFCEELLKAGGFVVLLTFWRREVDGVRDGIVYGALIGMGFAMTENVAYFLLATVQGGYGGLARALYLRALLQGFNHAAFTATTGAAVGWLCSAPRPSALMPLVGLTAAMAQHVLWNALGSRAVTQLLCGADVPGGACRLTPSELSLFVTVPLVVTAFIAPGGLVLLGLAVVGRKPAAR